MTDGAEPDVLRGRRVAVVEDEYFQAEDLRRILEQRGVAVVGPIGDLDRAMEIASPSFIDAAILDINLRGDLVYPVARILRESGVPFLFTTGYEARTVARNFAGVPRLEKPFDGTALTACLSEILQR